MFEASATIAPQPVSRPKRVSILGSTGSIGCNTLDVIAQQPQNYELVALTAHNHLEKLIEQARQFRPQRVVIGNEAHLPALKQALADTKIEVAAGEAALCEAASMPADWVMAAIVGVAGLQPVMTAIQTGATIAFASKECLVCAGELMLKACQRSGATLLPVDSEHNAIYQLFDFEQPESIAKVTLTASGGPFRQTPIEQLATITPEQAVRHPTWNMGAKISVDSATMMNKALEMIEAYHLFPLQPQQIEVVIHPQSIVHSFVHYRDGSVLAQLGQPDMRIPIAYTLGWPERLATTSKPLEPAQMGQLAFMPPDEKRFPALRLVREVLSGAQSLSVAFNAANEIAVEAFLAGKISFPAITATVEAVLAQCKADSITSIEQALYLNEQYRMLAKEQIAISS